MKKVIIIILSLLCVAATVFLGYSIFQANSISSVEVVGTVQQLYFVNETTDVNFNGAKLKVNYKNGAIREVDLKDSVSVYNFSTSITKSAKMTITYKSVSFDLNYAVIYNGMYYLSKDKVTKVDIDSDNYVKDETETTSNNTTATEMIYFAGNGVCSYYTKGTDSKYYMNDGQYDKTYNYVINGTKLRVNLGKNKHYDIDAVFSDDGVLSLQSNIYTYLDEDATFVVSKEVKRFTYYEMKTNRVINNIEVQYTTNPVIFKVGDTYETSGNDLYIKVTYLNDTYLNVVYVNFTDTMFTTTAQLNTSRELTDHAYCAYNGHNFNLNYKVVQA